MPLCKLNAWFQNVLPTVYDSASLSLYEAMGKVMFKLNEVIDLVNLLEANQPNVQNIIISILNGWLEDGTLADIINNEVLNNKADGHILAVTSLGADPTGVNDSTSAFNQAISKAQNDNYKLVIYPGSYKLSDYIFTDHSFILKDDGFYPDSKLIYCKPLNNRLCSQNFYSYCYQYDTPQSSTSPIPWQTQGIYFHKPSSRLFCAYQGAFTVSSFDGSKFTKIQTVINSNLGHCSTVTADNNFLYFSESPSNSLVKFSLSDLSYQGPVSLPNVSNSDIISHFTFNPSSQLFHAYIYHNSNQYIYLFDSNLSFIKSFPINPPSGVVQSSGWIDNNLIAISYDSNWAHDGEFGGMFLDIIDICSESTIHTFPFGLIRSFNECQGFTSINNDGDFIIYSYAQQQNIQSLFKFNFKEFSNPNFLPLASTNDSSIASIYPDKHLIVNSKSYPYPIANTKIANSNNQNDFIPIGSDIINVSPYLKGSASFPFATPQAAAASIGKFGKFTILLCGDTVNSPEGHLVINGADNITITSISTSSNIMYCPPIYISDCNNVYLSNLSVTSYLDWNNPHNNHNWAVIHCSNCNNVYIENCKIYFDSSTSAKNASGSLEVGSGIFINGVSRFTAKNVSTTNCRAGLAITNSNFNIISYSVTNDKYPIVIGNSIGTRSNNSNSEVYSYYLDDNPNFTSNITYAGPWNG